MIVDEYKLTQFAKGAGCGCKIAPAVLEQILANSRTNLSDNKNLVVGNNSNDDAAVYDIGNGNSLLITADFFMPIVDDAYIFGQVAAANALSDVYAMGGKPITAIALLGWPIDKLPAELAAKVMEGAKEICERAGIVISGGHTIDSAEPFFGLSVNGFCKNENVKRNSTAKVGDVLMLTKKLGVGILTTAQKRGVFLEEHKENLMASLRSLNSVGADFGNEEAVHAMTDVTGFGIMGHLNEMMESSGTTGRIDFNKLPILEEAIYYIEKNILPDASFRNWNAYSPKVKIEKEVDQRMSFSILPDPQTNGGLLISVSPESVERMKAIAKAANTEIVEIGRVEAEQVVNVLIC